MHKKIPFGNYFTWILLLVSLVTTPFLVGQVDSQAENFNVSLIIDDRKPRNLTFELRSVGNLPANNDTRPWIDELGDNRLHEAGQPEIPFYTRLIEIPGDVEVEYQIHADETEQVDLPIKLSWVGQPTPLEEDFTPGVYQEGMPSNINGTGLFPDNPIEVSDDIWVGGTRFLKLDVYPFQIDLATKKLIWHKKLLGTIYLTPQEKEIGPIPTSQEVAIAKRELFPPLAVSAGNQKVKIIVDHDGVYKVTASDLGSLGLFGLNPGLFKLTSQGLNIAIHIVNDNGNEFFDANEAIIFWGERFNGEYLASIYENENQNWFTFSRQNPDGSYDIWKPAFNRMMLEKYTDENVYWLTWEDEPGLKMQTISGSPQQAAPELYFRTLVRAEENRVWRTFPFNSEETWYWERIQGTTEITKNYPVTVEYPYNNGIQATLRGSILAAKTYESAGPDHHVTVFINDQTETYGDFTWDGKSRLTFEFSFPMSYLIHGTNQIKLVATPTASIPQVDLFIDWFEIEYDREFRGSGGELTIQIAPGVGKDFEVQDLTGSDILVFDLQDKNKPFIVTGWTTQPGANQPLNDIRFYGASGKYFIADSSALKSPKELSVYTSPDYLSTTVIDYVFITSPELFTATEQISEYRQNTGFQTAVVNFDNLINDFNYGIYHPIAIKNYFRFLLDQQGQLPNYALLVGDGHWNYHNSPNYSNATIHIPPNLSWVDPWQGEVDSANLLATIIGNDPLADLVIARLPVNTEQQALDYLNKLKTFDQKIPAGWHNTHLFIADNPDEAGNFYTYSNDIINSFVQPVPGMIPVRIFLENNPSQTNQEIVDFLNISGSQFVNYIGHGSINGWAAEFILQNSDVARLTNSNFHPIIVSMTCLDGYWIHPNQSSLIEELVRSKFGIIAAFSPTGLGVSTGHDIMHQAFYKALINERVQSLGLAVESAKVALFEAKSDYDLLHTFTIFGDPSIQFRFDWKIYIPRINQGQ